MTAISKLCRLSLTAALVITFAACSQNAGNKEVGGTLLGAAAGGLLGAQVGRGKGQLAAVAVGALLGAWAGNEVGKSLDRADRLAMQRTTQNTLETGRSRQPVSWRNPDSGHSGTITPQPAYQTNQGGYCREYQQTVTIDGRTEQAYGTACRQPDGTWKVVNR
ncbi:MAG: RT0821/Lpp0805 family surface protein [Alphaproteobacteria bacterium]